MSTTRAVFHLDNIAPLACKLSAAIVEQAELKCLQESELHLLEQVIPGEEEEDSSYYYHGTKESTETHRFSTPE